MMAITQALLFVTSAAAASITIAPGVQMPMANLGGAANPSNYSSWLQLGGRGLDTALTYGDSVQTAVAAAIRSTSVPRDQIFLTTKVPCCPSSIPDCEVLEYNGTIQQSIRRDVTLLGQPIDLLLLHWPCNTIEETVKAYAGLEDALEQNLTRSIGVSNFNASMLDALISRTRVKPVVNQCNRSVGAHNASHVPEYGGDDATVEYCARAGIMYEAYSPLGHGDSGVMKNPTVIRIGQSHNVSAAQVALRWLVQRNISFVTASSHPEYQKQDLDVFGFELTQDEMLTLDAL